MISQTAEYALRAVVALAQQQGEALTSAQIADKTRVPPGYLSKVLQALARAGVVTSLRGVHGGFSLAHPAAELTVLQVIEAVDPIKRIRSCPLGLPAHGANLCPLHRRLDEAAASIEEALGSSTIGELLAEPSASTPLCAPPPVTLRVPASARARRPRA